MTMPQRRPAPAQTRPGGVAKLGDPVQIGDEAFGIVFLRSGEERLERVAGALASPRNDVKVEGPERWRWRSKSRDDQLGVDRSE